MTRRLRALFYVRLSQSDDASTSIERQLADLRVLAEREGWDVVLELVDDGLSGGKTRAKAQQALGMLARGEVDVLAVWKLDRWSRQGLGAVADLIEALDANPRALFVADRDGLRSSQPAWRIIASVLAEVARLERENTQLRVLSSLAKLRTGGRYAGGQRPYGYVAQDAPDGKGRVLVVDPEEARVIQEAAQAVLDGASVYSVAHELNRRGVPSQKGARWSPTALRGVLVGDAVVGRVTHRGEVVRGEDGLPVAFWPPILDLETWHRLRAALAVKAPRGRRYGARLLSGIVSCASCGRKLRVQSSSKGYPGYTCQAKGQGQECPGVSVSALRLEEYVAQEFLRVVGDQEVMERVEIETDSVDQAEVERAITETLAAMADDDADVAKLAAQLAELKARRSEIRSRPQGAEVRLVGTGETFRERWERDEDGRRALLAANVAILAVSKGKRGPKGLDASRVFMAAQPAQLDGAQAISGRVSVS